MGQNPQQMERLIALRVAMRALPIITFGQIWTDDQQRSLFEILRHMQFNWISFAGQIPGHGWSAARIDALEGLWARGHSATEIANYLGDVSRNAVIGKAHRLGLRSRSSDERHPEHFFNLWDSPSFEGEMQQLAARGIIGCTWLGDERPSKNGIDEILHASEMLGDLFPSMNAGASRHALDRDFAKAESDESLVSLCWNPLWPKGQKVLDLDLPKGSQWGFWRRWYASRKAGRPLEIRDSLASQAFEQSVATILPDWAQDPLDLNRRISIFYRDFRKKFTSDQELDNKFELDNDKLVELQLSSQSIIGTQYKSAANDKIDIDQSSPRLLSDQDAIDRHQEVKDSAEDICSLFERFGLGANAAEPLVIQCQRLLEAVGESPSDIRPGLLLPRGERLRQMLASQKEADDFGSAPPLPSQFLQSLGVFVSAYNIFIALDPELARRDEARLDPDRPPHLVDKARALQAVAAATSLGIATEAVNANFVEVAENVSDLDHSGRSKRRFVETFRNFTRAALSKTYGAMKIAWKEQKNISNFSDIARKTTNWIIQHKEAVREAFRYDGTIWRIIEKLLDDLI